MQAQMPLQVQHQSPVYSDGSVLHPQTTTHAEHQAPQAQPQVQRQAPAAVWDSLGPQLQPRVPETKGAAVDFTMPSPSDLHPCLKYPNSVCQFGDKCAFAKLPRNTCVFFLKGRCQYGGDCWYEHPGYDKTSNQQTSSMSCCMFSDLREISRCKISRCKIVPTRNPPPPVCMLLAKGELKEIQHLRTDPNRMKGDRIIRIQKLMDTFRNQPLIHSFTFSPTVTKGVCHAHGKMDGAKDDNAPFPFISYGLPRCGRGTNGHMGTLYFHSVSKVAIHLKATGYCRI